MGNAPTLRNGDAGEYVTYLQEVLAETGAGSMIFLSVTGSFDDATEQLVRFFQAMHGLDVDGIVGPKTWTVIHEMDPAATIDMPPMILRPSDDDSSGTVANPVRDWEHQLSLNGSYLERTSEWETWPLLDTVNERFAERTGGYRLEAFEYDPQTGYPTEALELWFTEFDTVRQDTASHVRRIAGMIARWVATTRDDPPDTFDGFVGWVAETLGGADEPPMRLLDLVDGHLVDVESHLDDGRLRSAAYSLARAMSVQSWFFDAWEGYLADTTTGLERFQTAMEVSEEVAEEILIAAATGGVGNLAVKTGRAARFLQVAGKSRLARAGGVAVARGVGEVVSSTAEFLSHLAQGTSAQFNFTEEMKDALVDAASELGGGILAKYVEHSRLVNWIARPINAALTKSGLIGEFSGLPYTVARRLVTESSATLAEAMITTTAKDLQDGEFSGFGEFFEQLVQSFADEGLKNIVESSVLELSGARYRGRQREADDAIFQRVRDELESTTR